MLHKNKPCAPPFWKEVPHDFRDLCYLNNILLFFFLIKKQFGFPRKEWKPEVRMKAKIKMVSKINIP